MRCVILTPFGVPVDPDVNRIFAIESAPIADCARSAPAGSPSSELASPITRTFGTAAAKRAADRASGTNAANGSSTAISARSRAGSAPARRYPVEIGAAGIPAYTAPSATAA
jgi:hypothetical protein